MNNNIEYISKIKKGEEASFRHFVNSCSTMHSVSYEPKKPLKK